MWDAPSSFAQINGCTLRDALPGHLADALWELSGEVSGRPPGKTVTEDFGSRATQRAAHALNRICPTDLLIQARGSEKNAKRRDHGSLRILLAGLWNISV